MTTTQLAKTALAVARSLGLQPEQEHRFATLIMTECLFGNSPMEEEPKGEPPPAAAPTAPIKTEPRRTTEKRIRKMKEAAAKVNPVPKRLLCKAGVKCFCDTCKKPVFTILSDIYDGLKAEAFAAKFLPIGHGKTIPIPTRLRAVDGCVMTDCPVCGGDMSLILWGKKPEKDFEDGSVSSTGRLEG